MSVLLLPIVATLMTSDAAQARLAGALADADSVDSVVADRSHHVITFRIDRAGEAYEIVARTGRHAVVSEITIRDAGRGSHELGKLSWLADAMRDATAVVRLEVDEAGVVTLVTTDGTRYLALPGHGATHNDAVEARWGGEWNNT